MSTFQLFFQLGFEHILDPEGYDHILFVIALCAGYFLKDWLRIVILVTAFTIGHSLTLALAALNIIQFNVAVIEFLIPLSILITLAHNLVRPIKKFHRKFSAKYFYALFFGLIHGLGFSNYLRSILGKDASIVEQLLAFNIGLEVGQLIIVFFFMVFTFVFTQVLNIKRRDWVIGVSCLTAGLTIPILIENIFW